MVIIINGKGCCGKDSLVGSLHRKIKIDNTVHDVYNFSTIDKIKEIARVGGWHDDKSEKGRKLLSDLKHAFSDYNDLPLKIVMQDVAWYNTNRDIEPIFFVHIREPEEIAKAVKAFQDAGQHVFTMLVRRTTLQTVTYGNESDDNVEAPEGVPQSVADDFAQTVCNLYHLTK